MKYWIKLGIVSYTLFFSLTTLSQTVYKHSEEGTPRSLDPVMAGTAYNNTLITAIFDTLYEYKYLKRPYELKPHLAAKMPEISRDRKTYTITLKKGARFINDPCFKGSKGREVTAQDFVYSLKRHFDPANMSSGKWLWQDKILGLDDWGKKGADYSKEVEGLKALDQYRVQIKLKKPFPQLIYTFAMGYSSVVAKEAITKYGRESSILPVGSGPWALDSFSSKKAVLLKNPNYRKELFNLEEHGYDEKEHSHLGIKELSGKPMPFVDKVEVSFMPQESARWTSFNKGSEVQYSLIPTLQMKNVLSSFAPIKLKPQYEKKYHFKTSTELGYTYFEFNMANPQIGYHPDPERNKRNHALRTAIRKGFNWPQRIQRFHSKLGTPFPGIVPAGVKGYDPNLSKDSITLDIKGAQKIVADFKKKGTLPTLQYSGVATVKTKQMYAQFRGWMKKIGYPKEKVELQTFATFGDYVKAIRQKRLMIHDIAWGLDYPDVENVLQLYYSPNSSPGSNSANYNNPEYDKLYEEIADMAPSPRRTNLIRKANEILIEDAVVIAGFSRTRVHLWHKTVIMQPNRNVLGNYFKYVSVIKKKHNS